MSLPGYAYERALQNTDIKLQTLQDKDMILTLENNIRGGVSSVMGDRYVKSVKNKKKIYMDASNIYGHSMSQMLPYDEIEMWNGYPGAQMKKIEEILKTPDGKDLGFLIEFDLKYPDNIKKKTKTFQFALESKEIDPKKQNDYMKKNTT